MKRVNCSLCNSPKCRLKYRIQRQGISFDIARCLRCGMVYQNPMPTDSEIKRMYDKDYFHGKGFDEGVDYVKGLKYKQAWEPLHASRLETIEKYMRKSHDRKKGMKILDVGCGLGEFLLVARKRGWNVSGVELSKYSADIVKKRFHIPVFNQKFSTTTFKERYDVVTMFEVIEHLSRPRVELAKCRQILSDNGLLVIQTGDVDSMYSRLKGKDWPYYLAGHLNYFSKRTLTKMLEESGFEVVRTYHGDEITLKARWDCLRQLKAKKLIGRTEYFKQMVMQVIRKIGFGGMTVYAKKR